MIYLQPVCAFLQCMVLWGVRICRPLYLQMLFLHGRPIKAFNNGNMLRDFTYIDDIVEGVIRCLDKVAVP